MQFEGFLFLFLVFKLSSFVKMKNLTSGHDNIVLNIGKKIRISKVI